MADIELTVTANVPAGASLSIVVREDATGDGTFEAEAVQAISNGTNTYTLSGFTGGTGPEYYLIPISEPSDTTVDTYITSAEVDSDPTTYAAGSVTASTATPLSATATATASATASVTATTATPLTALSKATAAASLTTATATALSATPTTTASATGSVETASASPLNAGATTTANGAGSVTTATMSPMEAVWANTAWLIDGVPSGEVREEIVAWDSLSLTVRATRSVLRDVLRPLDDYAGEVEAHTDADGALLAYDRAGTNNTYTLTAPAARSVTTQNTDGPWPRTDTYHVEKYEETAVDQHGERYDVTLKLIPDASRETDAYDDSDSAPATGEWEFAFSKGRVSTKRVLREVEGSGQSGTTGTTLRLMLTPNQVKVLTESASYGGAVHVREVPDGNNVTEDNSTDKRQSVYVNPPTNGDRYLPKGNYRVAAWEVRWKTNAFYAVDLTLKAAGDTGKTTQVVATPLTASATTT